MKSRYLIAAVIACLAISASAQQLTQATAHRTCGCMDHHQNLVSANPDVAAKMAAIEAHTQQVISQGSGSHHGNVITIPVVVHVVYNTASENLSTAQINSQIDVLNEDFRRTNANASATLSQFQGVAADSEIEFCLATQDPQGNPHSGITRTSTSVTSFSTNDNVMFNATGGHNAWPASQYLNIWVCDLAGGLLGYAQFPGGPASTDGVVCDWQYFGRIGTATPPFHLGRTCTHEVGHWLNLRHIWGDGGCGVDDFVADTPTSDAPNYGCPLSHSSCGSLDMVQNYMDYTDDACMNVFSTGQKNRMRALFNPGGFRASILNSPACGPVVPPTVEYQLNQIFASMNFDGTVGTQYVPAVTPKCVGDPGTFTMFSLDQTGFFNVGFSVAALYPASAPQSFETAGGQIFHIDLNNPTTYYWNGGLVPVVIPYPGNMTIPYTAAAPVQFSAQMLKIHGSHPDGYYLSAGGQLDIGAGAGSPTPLTLGDDDSVSFTASSPVSFYGTSTSTVHVNSNGSVSLNSGVTDFTASVSEFLSGPPRIGCWSDLAPNVAGTIDWSEACGNTTISFAGLPEWGVTNPPLLSFDVTFWSNGDVSIDNRTVSPGWGTDMITGFTPGGGASGSSVNFGALVGGTTSYSSTNAIYEFTVGGSGSTFSSALKTPTGSLTVN